MRRRMSRMRLQPAAWALVVAATASACGGQQVPADEAPQVADRLDDVDAAVSRHDYPAAHDALQALMRTTTQAAKDGDLTEEQAQQIVASARRVDAQLPAAEPTEPAAPESPSASPSGTPAPDTGDSGQDPEPPGHGKAEGHEEHPGHSEGHGD